FLRARADGSLATTALALGKYTIAPASDGVARAVRTEPVRDARALDVFTAGIATLAHGRSGRRSDGRSGIGIEPPTLVQLTDAFTLARDANGVPSRWFEADCTREIVFDRAGADAFFGDATSAMLMADAMAAWTNIDGATIALAPGTTVA